MLRHKLKVWFVERNLLIAGYTAMFVFTVLFLIAIVYQLQPAEHEEIIGETALSKMAKVEACVFSMEGDKCAVSCTNVGENIGYEINKVVDSEKCANKKNKLSITNGNFPGNRINNNWLDGVKIEIDILIINNSNFNDIESGALSGPGLENLHYLIIIDPLLKCLRQSFFVDVSALTTFELKWSQSRCPKNFYIELDSLVHFTNLEILQINRCLSDEEQIKNMTGKSVSRAFSKLTTIDFSTNFIRSIAEDSFAKANKVTGIHLRDNELTSIHKNAFLNLRSLQTLSINTNQLTTLEYGIVQHFKNNTEDGVFAAFDNPWVCDCSLYWFKQYYLDQHAMFNKSEPLLCNDGIRFEEEDFGDCDSEPPETSTEETTSTTEATYNTTIIPCEPASSSTSKTTENAMRMLDPITIETSNHLVYFQFCDDADNEVTTTYIEIQGDITNYRLLWFETLNSAVLGCIGVNNDRMALRQLKFDTMYTMCLLKASESTVSPKSCFGLKTPEPWESRVWLPIGSRTLVISTTSVVCVVIACLTGVAVFFIIRQNPTLIKGNKRVVIVGRKHTDVIVMPKDYIQPVYVPQSGYLTPNSPYYEKVQYCRKRERGFEGFEEYINTVSDEAARYQVPNVLFENTPGLAPPMVPTPLVPPPVPPLRPSFRRPEVENASSDV